MLLFIYLENPKKKLWSVFRTNSGFQAIFSSEGLCHTVIYMSYGKKNSSRISQIDFLTIKLLTWQRIWYLCALPFRALRGMMHWFKPIPLLFLNLEFFTLKGSSHASSSMQLHLSLFILLLPPASPARWVGLFWHKAHLSFSWKESMNTHSCS